MNMVIMNNWVDVGGCEEIKPQSARRVDTHFGPVAIFRTVSDEYFALMDQCPHKKGPLSEGLVHGNAVACPLHNWTISLQTGEAQGADKGCTATLPLKVQDGRLWLGLKG